MEGRIAVAQALIEELTHQFFERRDNHRVRLPGRGHSSLLLPVPPISEDTELTVTVAGTELDPENYEINLESRKYPRLLHTTGVWPRGKLVSIVGSFGYVEADGSTPRLIKDLTKRLVVHNIARIGDVAGQRDSQIVREKLGNYEYELRQDAAQGSGAFGDPKIDRTLAMFTPTTITTV